MAMPQPDDGLKGLAPVKMRPPAGIMPNAQHQTFHGFMTGAPYELAIVEFDDQGRCYDRGQMDAVAKRLEALAPEHGASAEDVILIIFVHGWKHDARSDDDNLTACRTRRITTCAEAMQARDGRWLEVAGLVLVRQRPGSAKGVMFITLEDETGRQVPPHGDSRKHDRRARPHPARG